MWWGAAFRWGEISSTPFKQTTDTPNAFRHTHADVDGRHSIYTKKIYGIGEQRGSKSILKTFEEFDPELISAFKKDKVQVLRYLGIREYSKA